MGLMGHPMPPDRKPVWRWVFEDHPIGWGIWAKSDWLDVLLPFGLTNEARDVLLWTSEVAFRLGQLRGASDKVREIKRVLETD